MKGTARADRIELTARKIRESGDLLRGMFLTADEADELYAAVESVRENITVAARLGTVST